MTIGSSCWKGNFYARARGILERWIVDLTTDQVPVFREAKADRHTRQASIGRSGVLDIQALPNVAIPASAILV